MDSVQSVSSKRIASTPATSTTPQVAAARAAGVTEAGPVSTESKVSISDEALADEEGGTNLNLNALGGEEAQETKDDKASKKTDEAKDDKASKKADETSPEDLKKLEAEKEAEKIRKQIQELRLKMAEQIEQGDEEGAKATEAEIQGLNQRLDKILNPPKAPAAPFPQRRSILLRFSISPKRNRYQSTMKPMKNRKMD